MLGRRARGVYEEEKDRKEERWMHTFLILAPGVNRCEKCLQVRRCRVFNISSFPTPPHGSVR